MPHLARKDVCSIIATSILSTISILAKYFIALKMFGTHAWKWSRII